MGFPVSTSIVKPEALSASPSSFDWREYGRVTPVKKQSTNCGIPSLLAATALYESLLAIATKGTHYDLAEQYGLDCIYKKNCAYPALYLELQLYKSTGIPLESTYPFDKSQIYPDICTNTAMGVKINQTVKAISFTPNMATELLQQHLIENGPMIVFVEGNEIPFISAGPSGLISCSGIGAANYHVLLVGYNSTHWFVKNSWGTGWGDNGYGYIDKQTGHDCWIKSYAVEI